MLKIVVAGNKKTAAAAAVYRLTLAGFNVRRIVMAGQTDGNKALSNSISMLRFVDSKACASLQRRVTADGNRSAANARQRSARAVAQVMTYAARCSRGTAANRLCV